MTQPNKAKNIAIEWAERCAASNGRMMLPPLSIKEEVNEFIKISEEYIEKLNEFRRYEANFSNLANNFWHKMRVALDQEKVEGAYTDDIGWNQLALKDGIRVIDLVKKVGRGAEQHL